MRRADQQPSRRAFLGTAGAVVAVGGAAGCDAHSQSHAASDTSQAQAQSHAQAQSTPADTSVPPTGRYQAGVIVPQPAQPNLLAVVADIDDKAAVGPLLAELGKTVLALTAGTEPRLLGLAPGDLTITVGVGPGVVRKASAAGAASTNNTDASSNANAALPGSADLPQFSREEIVPQARGGDLLIQLCASDALVLPVAAAALLDQAGARVTERWRQSARRGPNTSVAPGRAAPRNLLGFIDGIIGPTTTTEQQSDLWLAGPAPVAGGTIAVVRRMELDLTRFAAQSVPEQEAVFGRRRATGVPLSGGTIASNPDLGAKTPDGRYLIPADAHVRRAHANVVGVGLMLRRSYSIDDPKPGLLFICFQNDLHTFTATLTHMDDSDALLAFTTTTASATFLILPGFDAEHALGSTLFG
ncbi:Dyp-type peroxidase [Catenulispora pinisilvae]|uniref:Dyp-type peroxidase n=1 Tax=Catenulispora pinisilvae TaxID=2705253 RepID=UPI00189118AC|nr:Dyp-type peroxidase [Catenulispora pinisilvae]